MNAERGRRDGAERLHLHTGLRGGLHGGRDIDDAALDRLAEVTAEVIEEVLG